MTMKKIREGMIFIGVLLLPILAGGADTEMGVGWALIDLILIAILAWDAGMMDETLKNK